ncbi:ATPase [Streptomyces palmae]|uniref:ATPase n=1 Tax=Streptomyces palmae TaxID=1701085 RepID=A0A4Z0HD16_9ACTN|nr:ATPase [Streptomyces palmae]
MGVAESGRVELDRSGAAGEGAPGPAGRRLQRLRGEPVRAVLSPGPPDLDALERAGRVDLLAGEAQLEERLGSAVRRGSVAAVAGWCPVRDVRATAARLAGAGGTLVPLPAPRGTDPPTLLRETGALRGAFRPLLGTYGTVPYPDLDPTMAAGLAYVVMFGVMFGDAGHGALLLLGALALRRGRPRRLARLHRLWPFVAGAGIASVLAGLAYGEFFGPTGVLPVLWLSPPAEPLRLLTAAAALGAGLLALAYAAGIANRWREGGPSSALYAPSGVAGALLFLGLGLLAGAVAAGIPGLAAGGGLLCLAGLVLAGSGWYAASSHGAGGVAQTAVQLLDMVLRIGSNTISFTRLAAFGLTHAALGGIVWQGTTALVGSGPAGALGAVAVFTAGNALAFALEALVAGVQALRLEFYELFSRVFEDQGRPFRPWRLPIERVEAVP